MASSFAFYAFATIAAAGLVSTVRPVRVLRMRTRRAALVVFLAGAVLAWRELHAPVLANYVTEPSSLSVLPTLSVSSAVGAMKSPASWPSMVKTRS